MHGKFPLEKFIFELKQICYVSLFYKHPKEEMLEVSPCYLQSFPKNQHLIGPTLKCTAFYVRLRIF